MEKIVRLDDIKNLFTGIIVNYQIGDFEYEFLEICNLEEVDEMIEKFIIPQYKSLDEDQKEWLKDSLSYFLTYETEKLLRLNDDGYIPFDFSNNCNAFFKRIWNKIFMDNNFKYVGFPDKILY